MTARRGRPLQNRRGFTLIEVIFALVIFAGGVLMVARLSGSLALQLRNAGIRSEVALVTQFRLDSLGNVDYDALTVGATVSTLSIQGLDYLSTIEVNQESPRVLEVQVITSPATGSGVTFSGITYVFEAW